MTEYIIEWSGIGARITELMGSETPCLAVKHLRKERLREQIVRCRDCKHFTYADATHGNDDWCAKHEHIGWSVNGFCAWGERKEKKPTDAVRKFAERYERRIAELEEQITKRTCRNIAEPGEDGDRPFTCSECGARGPYFDGTYHICGCDEVNGKVVFWDSWPIYKYCPHCGAKVIEEKGKGNDGE